MLQDYHPSAKIAFVEIVINSWICWMFQRNDNRQKNHLVVLDSAMPPRTGCCEGTMIINTWSLTAAALFNPYAF